MLRSVHMDPLCLPEDITQAYPCLIQMRLKPATLHRSSSAASKTLLNCVAKVLKNEDCVGMHTVIHASHFNLLSFFLALGFSDITPDRILEDDVLILGKTL